MAAMKAPLLLLHVLPSPFKLGAMKRADVNRCGGSHLLLYVGVSSAPMITITNEWGTREGLREMENQPLWLLKGPPGH